ncbi:unnamed protein product [Rotaria sp. Silwood1]|nr:unnamed protein product [Rotaria sp. Silwood1]
MEVEASDLSKSTIFAYFNHMNEHLSDFGARLSEFQRDLKEKIALYLPKIRGSTGVEESVLFNLFKQVDASPFNKNKLESWLREKQQEITLIKTWIENLTKNTSSNITIKSSSLDEVISDTRYEYIFCLSFRFVEENDPQLIDMHNYQYDKNKFNSSNSPLKRKTWFTDRHIMTKIRKNLREFIEFVEGNKAENGKIKFIVDEGYSINNAKSAELILYEDGLEKDGFIIPSKPYAPYAKFVTDHTTVVPLRASTIDIHPNARWQQNGLTIAGGNGQGSGTNQLSNPCGLFIDDDQQTTYIAEYGNHRIMEWKSGATSGQVVAGGNGAGSEAHQLSYSQDVIVDKETDSLIIADYANRRVVRWPRRNGKSGETIISNILCTGLTMDENGSLYVVDYGEHEVRRYRRGERQGTVVAGGNGSGNRLDQLHNPYHVFVDRDNSIYVSDLGNHRVMKWMKGAKQGIVVAGGEGQGNGLTQLANPRGVVVDQLGTVYVADSINARVIRWPKGATKGSVIVGGNGEGGQANQLNQPVGLSFDRHGNLYVVDPGNSRVQKFNLTSNA